MLNSLKKEKLLVIAFDTTVSAKKSIDKGDYSHGYCIIIRTIGEWIN